MSDSNALLERLNSLLKLTPEETYAVAAVSVRSALLATNEIVIGEGGAPTACTLVTEGMLGSRKSTDAGRGQITALHIPGDMPGLHSLYLGNTNGDLIALGPSQIASFDLRALRDLCAHHSRIAAALWRETLVAHSIAQEWLVNLGRRSALSRVAHLFCELLLRMTTAGRSDGTSCRLRLTQFALSELTGLSTVHTNRVLQDLRAAGLLYFDGQTLAIRDFASLAALADFQPDYLHLRGGKTPSASHSC